MAEFDVTYEKSSDAAYIHLARIESGEASRQVEVDLPVPQRGLMVLDFDRDGRLLGIEVIGASCLLRTETLRGARKPEPPK